MNNFSDRGTAAEQLTQRLFAERPSRAPDYQAENEALLALAQCLADSPSSVLIEMCNLILRHCNCESAGVSLLECDQTGDEAFLWPAIVGAWAPYMGGKMPRHASPCGVVIDRQTTLIFQDVEKDFPAAGQASPAIKELLLLPFFVDGKAVGTVWALTHHSGHQFDREDERRLKSLASFASAAYQFNDAQMALQSAVIARESANAAKIAVEHRWERLFQDLHEGFVLGEVIRDSEGRIVDWRYLQINHAWSKMLGRSVEEIVGHTIREVFPQIEEEWIDDFARVIDTGEPVHFTRQIGMANRWYDGLGQSTGNDQFTALFLDVTERVLVTKRQNALIALNDMLRDFDDKASMTRRVVQIVGEALDAERAGFSEIDLSQEFVSVLASWAAPTMPDLEGRHLSSSYGKARDVLLRGEQLVIEDVLSDSRTADELEHWKLLRTRAVVNMPVLEQGRTVAVLIVHREEPHRWTDGELAFLRNAADRLEIAIARRRAEEQQTIVNGEIAHRLKNTLATVQALAHQTLKRSVVPEVLETFTSRVQALASAHDALFGHGDNTAVLGTLIEQVLGAAGAIERYRANGPEVSLGGRATLSTSLLVHELATNALKYGALSKNGSIDIAWRLTGEGDEADLLLDWAEHGGPLVAPPSRRGFGSRILDLGLVGAGDAVLDYNSEGFRATFRASVRQIGES